MALVNLAQIKGGLALRSDVDTLIRSYDANKVLTTVVKTPAVEAQEAQGTEGEEGYVPAVEAQDAVNYDADELLGVLKAAIDDINGGGSGTSLASLQTAVDAINNKAVADIVKLELSAVYAAPANEGDPIAVSNYTVTVPENLAELVPSISNPVVPAYTLNNEPVLGPDGAQITFNLNTKTFSAVPHKLSMDTSAGNAAHYVATQDTTAVEGKTYYADAQGTALDAQPTAESDISGAGYYELVPAGSQSYEVIDETFTFKVFPTGTFTFSTLPTNFLLDNEEMKLIAYTTAINTLVKELAADQSVIEAITAKVGDETVGNQIQAAITKSSDTTGGVSVETITGDQYVASDDKVISEKLTLRIVDSITSGASATALADARNNADRIDAMETVLVPVIDQIDVNDAAPTNTFVLSETPNDVRVKMNINGQTYFETVGTSGQAGYQEGEFTVDRANKIVTWTAVPVAASTSFVATEDETAQSGKTYYADAQGTALGTQPNVGGSAAGLYEAVTTPAQDGFNVTEDLATFVRFEYFTGTFVARTVSAPTPAQPSEPEPNP